MTDTMTRLNDVTRVEVIDRNGRAYVEHNTGDVHVALQDDGRTLKVFHRGGFDTAPQRTVTPWPEDDPQGSQ